MSALLVILGEGQESIAHSIIGREAERAPDGTTVFSTGPATFAHAALLDGDPARSIQLLTRGPLTVIADARIDEPVATNDAEAIVDAYERYGADCAAHLAGDFAFVVYDSGSRSLFAARDFLGIRPLFYAMLGDVFVVASTINMIRAHPLFREELREESIARYLAGSFDEVPEETFYRGIRRLRPASVLTFSDGAVSTRRYPVFDPGAATRFRRSEDYVAHFLDLFDRATADRLRGSSAAIMMSGGLDSTSVAATARFVRPGIEIHAYTTRFAKLFRDDEATFAAEAAAALRLEHHVMERADEPLFGDRSTYTRAEPFEDPIAEAFLAIARDGARHAKVMLGGLGGDTLFRTSSDYFPDLVRHGRLLRMAMDVSRYVLRRGKLPPLGLRSWLLRREAWRPGFPSWLRPEAVTQFHLREAFDRALSPPPAHPVRPEAARWVFDPFWARYFETWDPGETRIPIDMTHPILDLRLVRALLSYPPMPWFADKFLMRTAMAGRLPDQLRWRPKTTLAGDPLGISVRSGIREVRQLLKDATELDGYVDRSELLRVLEAGTGDIRAVLPLTFSRWWRYRAGAY